MCLTAIGAIDVYELFCTTLFSTNGLTRVHYALTELLKRLSRGHYVPYLVLMEVLEIVLYNESCV